MVYIPDSMAIMVVTLVSLNLSYNRSMTEVQTTGFNNDVDNKSVKIIPLLGKLFVPIACD